ncbi:hypothetical protein [Streptomyces mashuensis]|nr:hypothetical protein [Streptomyces mashuensis]
MADMDRSAFPLFLFGAVWLVWAAALAASNVRSYRRRVTVLARCQHVSREKGGYRHMLRRRPVGQERDLVLVRSKEKMVSPGEETLITYDPKSAHLVYIGERYPRFTHGKAVAFFGGLALLLMAGGVFR